MILKRNINLLTIFVILFLSNILIFSKANAQDQRFRSGIILGVNGAQINGDNMAGFNKGGILGGLYVAYPFSEKWSGQFEMTYTQKGSRKVYTEQNPNPPGYWDNLRLDYIEVPVFAKLHLTKRWEFYGGVSAAYLMGYFLEDYYGGQRNDLLLKKTDFCLQAGGTYNLTPRLSATLRYSNSILSVSKGHSNFLFAPVNTGMINIVASLGLYYHFIPNKW